LEAEEQAQIGHSIADVVKALPRAKGRVPVSGLSGSDRAFFITELARRLERPLLVVTPSDHEARDFLSAIEVFSSGHSAPRPLIHFPHYHLLPFKETAYHAETASARLSALYRMAGGGAPATVVCAAQALMPRTIPRSVLFASAELIMEGEETDRERLLVSLVSRGYQPGLIVEGPGGFSVRGGILDVFPPGRAEPLRIEFFGDTVESIRRFSPANQRTTGKLSEAVLLPASEAVVEQEALPGFVYRVREQAARLGVKASRARETAEELKENHRFPGHDSFLPLLYEECGSVFDYLPPGVLCVVADPARVRREMEEHARLLADNYFKVRSEGRLCLAPETTHLTPERAWEEILALRPVTLDVLPVRRPGEAEGVTEEPGGFHFAVLDNSALRQALSGVQNPDMPFAPLAEWVEGCRQKNLAVVVAGNSKTRAGQIGRILAHYGLASSRASRWPSVTGAKGGVFMVPSQLSSGFVWEAEGLAVVTDKEIFGTTRRRAQAGQRPRTDLLDLAELKQGDHVVHVDHGIGRFEGLHKMDVAGVPGDFLLIVYKDGDRLYLPVDRTNLVQKYQGMESINPALDKLGGKTWERVKSKVKQSVEVIAGELLELYAKRAVREGHAYSPADSYFRDFEEAFEYEETPDQSRAIEDVLLDMERSQPMDRLVCGDVGYGKTEVALRAAFKAVSDAKQVALLAPTTILVEQHYETFKKRFARYPIEVACLNRFRSAREQTKIIEGLKEGRVDLVVGTHRLLSKDVAFKDLGLIIVDEEQRFGVRHKERLKGLRATVDVLALTATPIPRTLHMSLAGIRDISVITTPPEQRRPITTCISPFDEALAAEAVRRELARGGQVYFVHNSVETIWSMARRLQDLVPEARIGVGHGQLSEEELERVMMRFVKRELDMLVCTTIIESGLDIPAANTILVNRADRFGLAQIYQLRGRVGRGDEQAFAYLFIPDESVLTRDAQRRLKVLMEHSDLGAGFQLAMSDLQIRGGGTILGPSQSGHVAAVGYEMYLTLMEEAMARLKGEEVAAPLEPEITVDFAALFPEAYIPDTDQRLLAYRRLARCREIAAISQFREELMDRYGKPPDEASQLLYKVMLKCMCRPAGVKRLEMQKKTLQVWPSGEHMKHPQELLKMVGENRERMRLGGDGAARVVLTGESVEARVRQVKNVLKEMTRRVNG
jgi:transcription-repair coupling factor (superfamily II helicase)